MTNNLNNGSGAAADTGAVKVHNDTVANAEQTPDLVQPWADLGLKEDEYARIKEILGRRPTEAELAVYLSLIHI